MRMVIARLVGNIMTRLGEEEAGTGVVGVSSYLRRFGALVGLGKAEEAAALEAARRLEEGALGVPHNADSLAAAVVFLVLERAGSVTSVKDVAAATGLSQMTIYAVCRKLRPHHDRLFG